MKSCDNHALYCTLEIDIFNCLPWQYVNNKQMDAFFMLRELILFLLEKQYHCVSSLELTPHCCFYYCHCFKINYCKLDELFCMSLTWHVSLSCNIFFITYFILISMRLILIFSFYLLYSNYYYIKWVCNWINE